ncbi:hypothetical protein OIE66_03630 [Nonomuraea sp. NBC_01738]|nr:hypothetical protein OIE66_03630 [Nonomuraea sp. NBC_01738]
MRYLVGMPPAYARSPLIVDFAGGENRRPDEVRRNPECLTCGRR